MPRQQAPELADLTGKCVTVSRINGTSVTGFLLDVHQFMIALAVAGKTVFVPLFSVTEIKQAEGMAC